MCIGTGFEEIVSLRLGGGCPLHWLHSKIYQSWQAVTQCSLSSALASKILYAFGKDLTIYYQASTSQRMVVSRQATIIVGRTMNISLPLSLVHDIVYICLACVRLRGMSNSHKNPQLVAIMYIYISLFTRLKRGINYIMAILSKMLWHTRHTFSKIRNNFFVFLQQISYNAHSIPRM